MMFCEFLKGVQGAQAEAAIGVALSYLIELWKGYADLTGMAKRLIFLGLCLGIPLAAAGVGILSCGQSASFVDTWWPALVAGFVAFGTGTAVHTRKL